MRLPIAMPGRKSRHPNAAALLLIDFFNPTEFKKPRVKPLAALSAARATRRLLERARSRHLPVIYVNDNFGEWGSEFSSLVARCLQRPGYSGEIADLLQPAPREAAILKPRHSAFYGTPLEFLLEEMNTKLLILTGITADSCITSTAHDAHVRKFSLWIPHDCVAAGSPAYTRNALGSLRRVTDASIAPSQKGWIRMVARAGA